MITLTQGRIVEVNAVFTGDRLWGDHAAGVTTITVSSVDDFNEDGGQLQIGPDVYAYVNPVEGDETATISIAPGLLAAYEDDTAVLVYPAGEILYALVEIPGVDEAQTAEVPHGMHDRVIDEIRDREDQEPVVMYQDDQGEWHIFDITGKLPDIRGQYINTTGTNLEGGTDGLPPEESPTPVAIGGIGALFVKWSPINNSDPVRYQVHMSDNNAITPVLDDPATMVGETAATTLTIRTLPNNTPLQYNVPYYFWVIAKDDDPGSAPVSAPSDGATLVEVTSADIAANQIWAGQAYISNLIGGTLNGEILLAALIKTMPGDAGVELGPEGIIIYDSTGVPVITLPNNPDDPDTPATFRGYLTADYFKSFFADFAGTVNMRAGSVMHLQDRVQNPSAGPTISITWDTVQIVAPAGLHVDNIESVQWDSVASKWLVFYDNGSGFSAYHNDADGSNPVLVLTRSIANWDGGFSGCRVGNNIYFAYISAATYYVSMYDVTTGNFLRSLENPQGSTVLTGIEQNSLRLGVDYTNSRPMVGLFSSTEDAFLYQDLEVLAGAVNYSLPTMANTTAFTAIGGTIAADFSATYGDGIKATSNAVEATGFRTTATGTAAVLVRGGARYNFSSYRWASTSGLAAQTKLWWYDRNGNSIGTETINGTTSNVVGTQYGFTRTAPPLAKYVRVELTFTATASGQWVRWGAYSMGLDTDTLQPLETYSQTAIFTGTGHAPIGLMRGSFDFGVERVIAATNYSTVTNHWVWSTSVGGIEDGSRSFDNTNAVPFGLTWDGTRFWTLSTTGGVLYKHTAISSEISSGNDWAAAYTIQDRDVLGTGSHETMMSPLTRFTMKRRASVQISAPDMASPLDVDEPNGVGLYLGRYVGSTAPTRTEMWSQDPQPADGVFTYTYSTVRFAAPGVNPPATNNFPGGTPAQIVADVGGFNVNGDSSGAWGPFTFAADGSVTPYPVHVVGKASVTAGIGVGTTEENVIYASYEAVSGAEYEAEIVYTSAGSAGTTNTGIMKEDTTGTGTTGTAMAEQIITHALGSRRYSATLHAYWVAAASGTRYVKVTSTGSGTGTVFGNGSNGYLVIRRIS